MKRNPPKKKPKSEEEESHEEEKKNRIAPEVEKKRLEFLELLDFNMRDAEALDSLVSPDCSVLRVTKTTRVVIKMTKTKKPLPEKNSVKRLTGIKSRKIPNIVRYERLPVLNEAVAVMEYLSPTLEAFVDHTVSVLRTKVIKVLDGAVGAVDSPSDRKKNALLAYAYLTVGLCGSLAAQIFRILHQLHHVCHVLHRDIKPANMGLFLDMLDGDGRHVLKVFDFGISVLADKKASGHDPVLLDAEFINDGTPDFQSFRLWRQKSGAVTGAKPKKEEQDLKYYPQDDLESALYVCCVLFQEAALKWLHVPCSFKTEEDKKTVQTSIMKKKLVFWGVSVDALASTKPKKKDKQEETKKKSDLPVLFRLDVFREIWTEHCRPESRKPFDCGVLEERLEKALESWYQAQILPRLDKADRLSFEKLKGTYSWPKLQELTRDF